MPGPPPEGRYPIPAQRPGEGRGWCATDIELKETRGSPARGGRAEMSNCCTAPQNLARHPQGPEVGRVCLKKEAASPTDFRPEIPHRAAGVIQPKGPEFPGDGEGDPGLPADEVSCRHHGGTEGPIAGWGPFRKP